MSSTASRHASESGVANIRLRCQTRAHHHAGWYSLDYLCWLVARGWCRQAVVWFLLQLGQLKQQIVICILYDVVLEIFIWLKVENCSSMFFLSCFEITKLLDKDLNYNELNPFLSDNFSVGRIGRVVQCLVVGFLFFFIITKALSTRACSTCCCYLLSL